MKVNLSLAEEVIDVPDEAIIEETNPGEEVEESFKTLDSFFEIIDNLKHIQANIKKFGVTKELIHLVNTDNQLGRELNITLPYYEDDTEEINEEELPDGEELITATEGVIGKAKDGIVAAFKWLKEKISKFWNWLKSVFSFKKKVAEKKDEKAKEKVEAATNNDEENQIREQIKKTIDETFGNIEMSWINYDRLMDRINKVFKLTDVLEKTKIDKTTGEFSNIVELQKIGQDCGYEITFDNNQLSSKDVENFDWMEHKKGTLKSFGWTTIEKAFKVSEILIYKTKNYNETIHKIGHHVDTIISYLGAKISSTQDDTELKKLQSNINNLNVFLYILKNNSQDCGQLVSISCKISDLISQSCNNS